MCPNEGKLVLLSHSRCLQLLPTYHLRTTCRAGAVFGLLVHQGTCRQDCLG